MAFLMIVTMMPVNLMAEPVTTPTTPETYDLVDQNDGSYLDQRTENKYYKVPNWAEASVKNKGATKWELADDQILRSVSIPSEAYETVQLNYEGYHEDTQGNLILDLRFTWASRADSSVWKKMDLYISKDLSQKIDWTKSYYYNGYAGKVVRFEQGNTATNRLMLFSEMVQGALAGNVHHTPIKLFLKNTKREDLDKIDTTIQSRIINKDDQHIYTKYLAASNKSNLVLEGYTSYTSVTSVPKINATNFRAHLMPSLRNFGGALGLREDTPDILSSQTSVSYHPSKAQLYVASQWRKGSTGANGNVDYDIDGDLMAYRLAFNKELADALKEDENGFVGYIEPSTTSGAIAKNLMGNVTGFTKQQINIEGDMAYVIFAPQGYKAKDNKQVVTTKGGTNGFVNNQTTLLTGSQYTVTRLNVKSDALKNLYPTLKDSENNDFKPELLPLDFHSSMVLDNTLGMDTVTVTTTEDVVASENTNVQVVFTNSPSAGAETKQQNEANKLAIKIANLPIAGDLAVYSRGAAGSLYSRTGFTLSNGGKTYTSKLLSDVKIPKGSKITLYAGYGGNLVNNSADIYIGSKKVASFTENQARKSFAPRALVGTESMASTLLDRTQYMPALLDTYDTDTTVEGYTFINKQIVDIEYNDNASKTRKSLEAVTSKDAEADAKYLINGKEYPVQGKGLYKFTQDIGASDKLIKDAPISARAFHYDTADDGSNNSGTDINIKSAVGSDPVIAKVLSKVTFDLNGGKYNDTDNLKIKSFEGGHPGTGYKTDRQAANSPVIRIVPINTHFATDSQYKPNGFEGTDAVLKDNTGADLTGDALALRKFPGKGTEEVNKDGKPIAPEKKGAAFLGWTTKKLEGDAKYITETFAKLKEATTLDQVKDQDPKNNFIFTEKTPVDKSITVYAAYGSPSIRIHSNFDADGTQEGLQETVHKQALTSEIVKELETKDPSAVEVKLEEVINKDGFKRTGYSLVGFSRDKDANEPDINVTGDGLTQDLYLRDGDTFKLAASGTQKVKTKTITYDYKFDAQKGLDLYAVWKKDFTVTAKKTWLDKNDQPITPTAEQLKDLEFALICRPAVGTFGYEVVVKGATYYPVKGSEKAYDANGLTWDNLKGYDEKGRRMSYIVVELKTPEQKAAFKNGSTTWSDYGIKIEEKKDRPDGTVEHWGRKTQYIELGNSDVDAFSSATVRKHTSDSHPEGVATHSGVSLGYFDTTGYIIEVKNNQWDLIPPTIDQAYVTDDDNKDPNIDDKVFINPPKRQLSEITITLPDGKKLVLIPPANLDPNKKYAQYVKKVGDTTSDVPFEQNDKGQIVLSPRTPLKVGEKYKAVGAIIAGQKRTTQEAEMTVKDRPLSNKVEVIKQGKLTSNDQVPINFVVPEPTVTDKPTAGTVYTILIKDKNGNVTTTEYTYTIPVDDAARIPGTTQTILVPKSELLDGKKIIIKAKEPNKKSAYSDEFTPDVVGPKATGTVRDERWRRWTKLDLQFDEIPEGDITITYEENGESKQETAPSKNLAKVIVEKLKLDPSVTNIKIKAADSFGNVENPSDVQYKSIGQTVIRIQKPLRNRNFVYVTTTEADTVVTITVYKAGTTLDSYEQDQYFNYTNIPADSIKHSKVVTFTTAGRQKITLDQKLESGDVVDIVGRIGTEGRSGFKITNPYTWIVK